MKDMYHRGRTVLPGPLAPPRKIRPRRKIIARSYSFTIYKDKQKDLVL